MKKIFKILYLLIILFNFNLVYASCSSELGNIIALVKLFITIIQIVASIGLVIMGCLDYFKAVTDSDPDKEIKKATKMFINRLIAGVMIFVVFSIVTFAVDIVAKNNNEESEWKTCWTNYNALGKEK